MTASERRPGRVADAPGGAGALGWLGLEEYVAPMVQRIVAERLAPPGTALTELAEDDATLAAIATDVEQALGVTLPAVALRHVTTTGDLVDVTLRALAVGRRRAETPFVRIRFMRGCRGDAPFVEHLGACTPYFADLVRADARRMPLDGRIDVWFGDGTPLCALVTLGMALSGAVARRVGIHSHPVPLRHLGVLRSRTGSRPGDPARPGP